MRAIARFLLLLAARLVIPFSFVAAIICGPVLMLSAIRKWPQMLRDTWDDPFC